MTSSSSTSATAGPAPAYFTAYENLAMERSASGVLTLRFHTDGGPITFTGQTHSDLPRALEAIAEDRDNQVLILTGTGDRFMTDIDGPSLGDITKPLNWDRTYAEGRRVLQRLVDLEMPIVSAVNGPASVHSEYVLLGDVVVAAESTVFSDYPHLTFGIVPGDGIQVVWEEILGFNRARHLIMTQGSFTAQQALDWGAVAEVVPQERVLERAVEIAEQLARRPQLLNRYLAVMLRQRVSRRMAEGTALGMALEGLTAADMAYRQAIG
ncbi:enoyl-CoA hydratase/isomerase family protein [Pseudonocardia xinjiangensis]|uniref:enoyl-CoA hydratase/isomerase family protein n=1 Tax=Pseudonocardia xinjiangensis TaxID=75289 RepID=UPI003D8C069A